MRSFADLSADALGVPRLVVHDSIPSTMDAAHALASDGAPAGTVVLAETQTAGRGRNGRRWSSAPGAGIWMTVIERPAGLRALDVLSLRLGLAIADAIERFAEASIRVKWPNDLYVADRKLAGVLVETRWRDGRPEWIAIGVGVNVAVPAGVPDAIGLRADAARVDVLHAVVPAIRHAATSIGPLGDAELDAFRARDFARGRRAEEPLAGCVEGISADGALRIRTDAGSVEYVRHGTLRLGDTRCDAAAG